MTTRAASLAACVALLFCLALGGARAQATLPELTGRVSDDAAILSPDARAGITDTLAAFEAASKIQLVVATVKSLGGEAIEPYATRLFNAWALGDAARKDGVLLLIAKADHRVRIEVGRGLEGRLTNARAAAILADAVLPAFKNGDFDLGARAGVDAIIAALREK